MSMMITPSQYTIHSPQGLQFTPALARALKGKPIADAYDFVAYDRLRYKPATAVPTNTLRLFTTGVGQSVSVANSAGETYIKDYQDTNLQDGNRLPRGQFLIVHSIDRKSTRLNSSHLGISYAVFCLKKK